MFQRSLWLPAPIQLNKKRHLLRCLCRLCSVTIYLSRLSVSIMATILPTVWSMLFRTPVFYFTIDVAFGIAIMVTTLAIFRICYCTIFHFAVDWHKCSFIRYSAYCSDQYIPSISLYCQFLGKKRAASRPL